jgi:hypothetical protein
MASEILGKCPVCGSETEVTRISCDNCDTIIEGHFRPCKFCRLTSEQKMFIDVFIKCRGNIKEVEKELGISYPTVKNRLEDVVGALGYKPEAQPVDNINRKDVLDKLNKGEIGFEEAMDLLKDEK